MGAIVKTQGNKERKEELNWTKTRSHIYTRATNYDYYNNFDKNLSLRVGMITLKKDRN